MKITEKHLRNIIRKQLLNEMGPDKIFGGFGGGGGDIPDCDKINYAWNKYQHAVDSDQKRRLGRAYQYAVGIRKSEAIENGERYKPCKLTKMTLKDLTYHTGWEPKEEDMPQSNVPIFSKSKNKYKDIIKAYGDSNGK